MMNRFNIILLLDEKGENVLMCRRLRPPYQGLLNLVGGKINSKESDLHAAYRELREETGVTIRDTVLTHFVTFTYPMGCSGLEATELQAYVGRLRHPVNVVGEENPLCWVPMTENFFDLERFSGEGNIGHVLESIRRYAPELLEATGARLTITPISEADLPEIVPYQSRTVEELQPMLSASQRCSHDGRYYEQFAIRLNGCLVGTASLYAQEDGVVSDGIDVYPAFRRCGIARESLLSLMDIAREKGYTAMTSQIRVDNAASIALHEGLGFCRCGEAFINRRGHEAYRYHIAL